MKKNTLKSSGAVVAGFIITFVLSVVTDLILERTGVMQLPFNNNSNLFIVCVILYRSIYTIAGCYLTARIAPINPMRHALILGSIGFVISIAGAIIMWHEPPHWYAVSLVILTLPCAWLGGKLQKNKNASQ